MNSLVWCTSGHCLSPPNADDNTQIYRYRQSLPEPLFIFCKYPIDLSETYKYLKICRKIADATTLTSTRCPHAHMKLNPSTRTRLYGSASPDHPRGYAAAPDEIFVRVVVLQAPAIIRVGGPVLVTLAAIILMTLVLGGVMQASSPDPRVWLS